ncbi:GTP-binding protein [Angomonas deanei]|nr:GTP-binding protein [Angomonas deanei]|eukprot:EPY35845.1 GTP-binding protein [Angomonas deanei]
MSTTPVFMRSVKRTLNAYRHSMEGSARKATSREAFVDIDEKGAAWYLGHMRTGAAALEEKVKSSDFVLEIRDARLPFTTENPNIRRLTAGKPRLIIFNKAELSNADVNHSIQQHYERNGHFTLFTSAKRTWKDTVEAVQRFVTHVLPPQPYKTAAYVGLVIGMPNVGKSTLINSLRLAHEYQFHREDFRRSRTPETVSIVPGTTRGLKLVPLSKDPNVVLYDSPGLTVPGVLSKEAGLKLCACGIIPTNNISMPESIVARYIYDVFAASGSSLHLSQCLRLPRAPVSFDDCIAMICERSGTSGQTDMGNLDPKRAQHFLIHDFQMGNLGRISLDALPRAFHRGIASEPHRQLEGGNETVNEEDTSFVTHVVKTEDVYNRYPDYMSPVMSKLKEHNQSGAGADNNVISRKKGPISAASVFDHSYVNSTRLKR